MTFVTQQQAYGSSTGITPTNAPWIDKRDPTTNDINYPVGKFWINTTSKNLFYLNGFNSQTGVVFADWVPIADVQNAISQYQVVVGGPDNSLTGVGPGSAGQILQSGGASANPSYSTATYPSTASAAGTFIQSDGANYNNSSYKLPTAAPANGTLLQSNGIDILATTATYPSTAGTNGTLLQSNGTNIVNTTATYPSGAGVAGQILQSNGTGYVDCNLNAGTGISLTNAAGNITINSNAPSVKSSFNAYLSTTQTNVTGNNVYYPIICDVATVNVNNNYNTTTGSYTAPANGSYQFNITVGISDFTNVFSYALCTVFNVTQNKHYTIYSVGPGAANPAGGMVLSGSTLIYANANDVINFDIQVNGPTQTIDVLGLGFGGSYVQTCVSGAYLG